MEVLYSTLAAQADLGGGRGDHFLSFSLPRTKKSHNTKFPITVGF